MSSNKNGQLPREALVEVEPGLFLERTVARAYRRAKGSFGDAGKSIRLAGLGAAYRSLTVQKEMRLGSLGDKKFAKKYNLSSSSTVPLAVAGSSSHGLGDRIDILINGSDNPSTADIEFLARFGWTREFGSKDRNHFQHKGQLGTAAVSRAWCIAHGLFVQPEK